ncbi:MAG TPA: methyltransferase domain-containing protein [Rubricoccaceae bacterium]|nr:methyltransferase domain-containing protein [Rubricoccaceae bacterium]
MPTASPPAAPDAVTADVQHFFDGYAADFDSIYGHARPRNAFERFVDRTFRKSMFLRFEEVLRHTAKPEIRSVLDVGCGSGRYVVEFLRQGKEVVALDIAREMLDLAEKTIREAGVGGEVAFVHAPYLDYAPGRTFDAAVLMGFFDYIREPAPVLAKLGREVTREVYMSFPKAGGPLAWQRAVRYRLRKCPLYLYTRLQVEGLLREAGWAGRYTITEWGRELFVKVDLRR